MTTPLRILIVGSGVAGSVFALALQRLSAAKPNHEIEILLVDSAASFRAVGAGFSLTANAVRPLRQLGILDKLLEVSQRCRVITMNDESSQSEFMAIKQPPLMYGQPLITVERVKMLQVILEELESHGIVVQYNRRLETLAEIPGQAPKIQATFADGSSEIVDLIVGADGAWSRVRDYILDPSKRDTENMPYFSGWCGVVGVSEPIPGISDEHLGETHWIVPRSEGGGFGTWGLPDHRQFWYITESDCINPRGAGAPVPRYTAEELKASLDKVAPRWHPLTGTMSKIIENTKSERIAKIPMVQRVYPKIVSDSGKVALIGDAAHPMTPFIGQGAAMGIEDAIVLANAILPRSNDEIRGPKWYAEQRVRRTAAVVKQGVSTGKLSMGETFLWRAIRRLVFGVLKIVVSRAQAKAKAKGGPEPENSGEDRGPMAWIHKEKFELEL